MFCLGKSPLTAANSLVIEEDDLGFDPFQETQKALAELLESESKLLQQRPPADHALDPHINSAFSNLSLQPASQKMPIRPKAPPPGFNLTSRK